MTKLLPAAGHDPDRLLDVRAVERLVSLKKAALMRMAGRGEFPPPVVLRRDRHGQPSRLAWREAAVRAWIARLTADPTRA